MMLGISWLWWIVGTLGLAGTVALALFAPAVFTLVLQAVTRFIGWMLSTRIGCAVLAAVVAFVVADVHRSYVDHKAFEKEKWEFEQQQAERDTRIAQETRDEVWKEIADSTAANTVIDTDVKEFKDGLPPVPYATGNPFRVGADACRLRRIAGQAGCGPESGNGRVPTPRRRPKGAGDHR